MLSHIALTWFVFLFCSVLADSPKEGILLLAGEGLQEEIVILEDGQACPVDLPSVSQPWGTPGRRGASAAYWNGTVIVCGGLDSSGPPISSFRDCQVLDLTSLPRKWSSGPEMPDLLAYSGHTLIGSRLYVIGGYHTSYPAPGPTQYVYSNKTYVLDMASMTDGWREAEFQLAAPTADLCAVSTDNGRIAMIGALSGSFDPNSIDSWIPLPDQGGSGMGCALGNVTVAGSIFVAVGGGYLRNQVQTLFLPGQDGPSETWQSNIPALQSDRTQMPSVHFFGDNLVVVGGSDALNVERFANSSWMDGLGTLTIAKRDHVGVRVPLDYFEECH